MSVSILYIDGENLRHYINSVLESRKGIKKVAFEEIDYAWLFDSLLKDIGVGKKRYYSARLQLYEGDLKKSKILIKRQRILKANLERQGFEFVFSGHVRSQEFRLNGKKKVVFREKGVDVGIAVDMVVSADDKKTKTIILCSSDSDLQPAVRETRKRGIEVIYLGFEVNPNRGLTYTTSRTILIRDFEVVEAYERGVKK